MDFRILIPTDFSANALNACRYALQLYEKQNCEWYFLNVFRTEGFSTRNLYIPEPGSEEFESAREFSEKNLAALLDSLNLEFPNYRHRYHHISDSNFLSESMKKGIAAHDIDLVVMGTQGATGARGVILGSNTVWAMEKIRECPVLAVPEGVAYRSLKEVVFPTDFKQVFKRKELNFLIALTARHEAAIRVLHVSRKGGSLSPEQLANKNLLDEILKGSAHSHHTVTDEDVAEGLRIFVESRESDLIAFINRKHFFFGSIFTRPLVKEIGYDATTPILALH